jgi:SAM-dependent methyltransferase
MPACPLCGSEGLVDYHDRPSAACASCGALERQRALARDLDSELAVSASGRCLEVAPLNPFVFGGYLRRRGWRYEAVDKRLLREASDPGAFDNFIELDRDLADLYAIPGGRYELILLQHVLGEVPDYPAALDELSRVLAPEGRAILEIPWDEQLPATRHQSADRYGNRWAFGRDLLDDLGQRFAEVEPRELAEGAFRGSFFLCRGR